MLVAQESSFSASGYSFGERASVTPRPILRVFMMDLLAYTPHYDRYLCEGLATESIAVTLGSVSPYQEPEYFCRNKLRNDPGLVDVVPKLGVSNDKVRRVLMLLESCINMVALLCRFAVAKPDIVHVQWTPLARRVPFEIWFLRRVKAMRVKLVYTVHNVLPHDTGSQFAPVFRQIYREMDALICHSHEAKRRLIAEFEVEDERVWVIPHGPLLHDAKPPSMQESRAQLSLPKDETLVLWQGFIRSYKGLEFLLDAWQMINAKRLRTRLLIAGVGEVGLMKEIETRISHLSLKESVHLDFRFIPEDQLLAYYQASDIVVYPYREVTTSGALMTALAFHKPIVATALPAFREVLYDSESALLVQYGDVKGLAQALTRLIQDPTERERLALAATRARGSDNSWIEIAKKTCQCYVAVLQGGRSSADIANSVSLDAD